MMKPTLPSIPPKTYPIPYLRTSRSSPFFPAFDTTDSLVSRDHKTLAELPAGSVIGTSSPLRKNGLNELRPDLTIKGIRGCIEERVQQVKDGKYDAAIVATCALKRLGMENEISEVLPFATHPLQGFLAVTAKKEKNAKSGECALHSSPKNLLNKQGIVSLVGFGPGDPELLTIKAAKAIEQADIIFYDDLIDTSYLVDKKAEKVYVGKRAGYHHKEQGDINRLLLDAARAGKQVVRLKGGDPMIFAHGSEEIEYLESNLVHVNVIPGITTASALAASQRISLTHRDFSSSVALVSGHTPQPVTPDAETLVYYMGAKQLQTIAAKLIDEGWAMNTPVLLTYNVSRADEQTFETTLCELRNGEAIKKSSATNVLETSEKKSCKAIALADLPTPLIALIGYVAALKYHQASIIKPTLYTGTLPPLEKRKPDYTYTPLIEIRYRPISNSDKEYLDCDGGKTYGVVSPSFKMDEGYDRYFLFTSQHSVAATFRHFPDLIRKQEKSVFISIGKTTTEALHQAGIKDVKQVERDNRFGVIEWFKKEKEVKDWHEDQSVFYPHSALSPEDIPLALEKLGFYVTSHIAYDTVMPRHPRRVNINHFKRIVFTSPSTIDNFIKLYGMLPDDTEFITRGPVTQAHLEEMMKNGS